MYELFLIEMFESICIDNTFRTDITKKLPSKLRIFDRTWNNVHLSW